MASEFDLHNAIYAHNRQLSAAVTLPPGDDMGMLRLPSGQEILAGVDQVVDGQHFNSSTDDWAKVGRKAVARSLSDVAAMAAQPIAALATGLLPPGFPHDQAMQLFDGMRTCAADFSCPLIGGDIASFAASNTNSGPVSCTVTVFAQPGPTGRIVTRKGAQPGDVVCVTGVLGGGWNTAHHFDFTPRIKFALALVNEHTVNAMIDISDGLGQDLDHIAQQSGVAAILNAGTIPIRPEFDEENAMRDGEDYELCFVVSAVTAADLPTAIEGVPITQVGRIVDSHDNPSPYRTSLHDRNSDNTWNDLQSTGWMHE